MCGRRIVARRRSGFNAERPLEEPERNAGLFLCLVETAEIVVGHGLELHLFGVPIKGIVAQEHFCLFQQRFRRLVPLLRHHADGTRIVVQDQRFARSPRGSVRHPVQLGAQCQLLLLGARPLQQILCLLVQARSMLRAHGLPELGHPGSRLADKGAERFTLC